jgi:ABC-2 type transport system permease protein
VIRLLNLILNEQMKIYRRLRTWILGLLLIIIVVLAALFSHSGYETDDDNWKTRAAETIEHNTRELQNLDVPAKFKKQMRDEIALQKYMLDHNYPPTDNTLWGGTLSAAGLIMLVTLFTVIIAGDMVAGEFTWGTIKLLLFSITMHTNSASNKASLPIFVRMGQALFRDALYFTYQYPHITHQNALKQLTVINPLTCII